SIGLAVRQSGAEATAVAVANALRVSVPASIAADVPTVAGTIDDLGGVTVAVPQTLRSSAGTDFPAGPARMTGDSFVRYMTGTFVDEDEAHRDERQLAGWRALLLAATRPEAPQALATWT